MKPYLSCYFYPTTVVCVDDDMNLLKSLKTLLEENNPIVGFHSPFEAKVYLQEHAKALSTTQFAAAQSLDRDNIQLYIDKIHELIYDANRFKEVSSIVVDYYMPGINGLAFCRDFEGSPYKKIMLTGEADQALAVSAFNEGIINQFVMKGEVEAIDRVKALVQKMQGQFFEAKTSFLIESLLQLDAQRFQYFTDVAFCEHLQKMFAKRDITEMYLFNQRGAYLLIDRANNLWWLRIRGSSDLKQLKQEAKNMYLQEPSPEAEQVYNIIESGKKLPLCALLAETPMDIEAWEEVLVAPVEIKTPQDTYHVLIGKDIGKAALRYKDIKFLDF